MVVDNEEEKEEEEEEKEEEDHGLGMSGLQFVSTKTQKLRIIQVDFYLMI